MPDATLSDPEIAVVGGGLVGMAVTYGLQRQGARVHVYDEGDEAFRASRGNFALHPDEAKLCPLDTAVRTRMA